MIRITEDTLDINAITNEVIDPACGGIDVFVGTVRNQTKGKEVTHLFFETYESMAISEMNKIASLIKEKWPVQKISIHHRVGRVEIGEVVVVIAVSSPHRKEAFEACQFAIDTLKNTVPIWKKEFLKDGEVWVSAYP
ncbi:molybdenum cofactor biosynthesis protein MoaE [Fulvivirga lutea]|uniref:Molybdopterin synthase catalytic subunit n=1 Tax=Fulvivirga lutea TaxID=2810512 RepID=A0A974WH50_9BACT|nr:molybdenum cofactor biosynthesis protein MoaE [Fulvivirga lutea]QSE96005.1 molybdenum cofactor biosynthesis protein MoaE [Fulvivirga lutea]